MIRFGLAVLVSLAFASSAFGAPVEGAWSEPANGLQSRVVLDRATFKAGEPIDARVEVKNAGDKPVAVTRLPSASGESLAESPRGFEVTTPNGKPAVDISHWFQSGWNVNIDELKKRGPPPQPMLEAGRTIVFTAGLEDYYYLGKPGRYSIRWKGAPAALSARDQWEEDIHRLDWDQPQREPPRPTIPALPAAPAVQFEVQPGAPDPVGPLLDILPPGWRLGLTYTRSRPSIVFGPHDQVQPPGRKAGKGMCLTLTHYPIEGTLPNNTGFWVYVMDAPAAANPEAKAKPAEHLGKGPLGCVYLGLPTDRETPSPEARWHHLRYDVATALGVTEAAPAKPAGPDWGRMMCAILKACADERLDTRDHFPFCARAVVGGAEEQALLSELDFTHNAKTVETMKVTWTRDKPDQPYYRVFVKVMPLPPEEGQPASIAIDRALDLTLHPTTKQRVSVYDVKRLGIRFHIAVYTDDDDFKKKLDAILDREVTRVLAAQPTAER